jgi:hypothetical protein
MPAMEVRSSRELALEFFQGGKLPKHGRHVRWLLELAEWENMWAGCALFNLERARILWLVIAGSVDRATIEDPFIGKAELGRPMLLASPQ